MARLERAAPIAAVGLILGASGIAAYAAKTADDDVFYACLKKGRLTDVREEQSLYEDLAPPEGP